MEKGEESNNSLKKPFALESLFKVCSKAMWVDTQLNDEFDLLLETVCWMLCRYFCHITKVNQSPAEMFIMVESAVVVNHLLKGCKMNFPIGIPFSCQKIQK